MKSSPTFEILGEDWVEVVLDRCLAADEELGAGTVPTASRMSSVWPFAAGGLEVRGDRGATTASETGWTPATRLVGSSVSRARGRRPHLRQQLLRAAGPCGRRR